MNLAAADYCWHIYPTFGQSDVRGLDCMLPLQLVDEGEARDWFHAAALVYCVRQSWPKGSHAN